MARSGEGLFHQLLSIVDDAHGGDGEQAQVAAHQQGLGVGIGDTAHTGNAGHLGQIIFKLGAEGRIFNVVNLPLKALLGVVENQAAPAGAQVGVVVRAEKDVVNTVAAGNCAKETTHRGFSSLSEIRK